MTNELGLGAFYGPVIDHQYLLTVQDWKFELPDYKRAIS